MPIFDSPTPISALVDVAAGTIRIFAGDRTDTTVDVRPTHPSSKADVQAAEQTAVHFDDGGLRVKGARSFGRPGSIDVTIELPTGSILKAEAASGTFEVQGRLGDASVKTASGDIRLDGTGSLQVRSHSGDVTVERAGGDADITCDSGTVRVGSISGSGSVRTSSGASWIGEVGGGIRVSAASGAITVDRAGGEVRAKTASGSVRVGEVVRGRVELTTASGDLEVGVRGGTAAWLDLNTASGLVTNTLVGADGPEESDETVEIKARTASGDITVRRS